VKKIKTKNWYFHVKHANLNDELGELEERSLQEDLAEERDIYENNKGNEQGDCRNCDGTYHFNSYCGAYVCDDCDDHKGLARCYCGWSADGGDGYEELNECGECPI
jgi:hypothetical protein|tara:strand:- start:2315 stop:2632 length:318 start_codon:yes stop_codon:yes gene_type:complete